jgi:hypothetical protein
LLSREWFVDKAHRDVQAPIDIQSGASHAVNFTQSGVPINTWFEANGLSFIHAANDLTINAPLPANAIIPGWIQEFPATLGVRFRYGGKRRVYVGFCGTLQRLNRPPRPGGWVNYVEFCVDQAGTKVHPLRITWRLNAVIVHFAWSAIIDLLPSQIIKPMFRITDTVFPNFDLRIQCNFVVENIRSLHA